MQTPLPVLLATLLLAGAPLAQSPPTAPASGQDDFASVWYDGKAELNGYVWRGSRYGSPRTGEAVAIFVTEPFDPKAHVKVDDASRKDAVTALKLNLVRDFQTGIYDYDTTVSCFVRADDLSLMKMSFASEEWCGIVYEELNVVRGKVDIATRSYFEGESGEKKLDAPGDGLVGEQLFVWLRGLHGAPPLAPGETNPLPFLAGPFERRLRHAEAGWGAIRITRSAASETTQVPAGTFQAIVYTLEAPDGRAGEVRIEEASPHHLLSWTWRRGDDVLDSGQLTGTTRLPYWQLHGPGQESYRAELGLPVPAPR